MSALLRQWPVLLRADSVPAQRPRETFSRLFRHFQARRAAETLVRVRPVLRNFDPNFVSIQEVKIHSLNLGGGVSKTLVLRYFVRAPPLDWGCGSSPPECRMYRLIESVLHPVVVSKLRRLRRGSERPPRKKSQVWKSDKDTSLPKAMSMATTACTSIASQQGVVKESKRTVVEKKNAS